LGGKIIEHGIKISFYQNKIWAKFKSGDCVKFQISQGDLAKFAVEKRRNIFLRIFTYWEIAI
jgi:hypothetical protein